MAISSDRNRTRRTRLLELGLCVYCGRRPPRDGKQMCADCAAMQRARNRAGYQRLKQLGYCVICREPKRAEDKNSTACSNCRKVPASQPCIRCGGKRDRRTAKLCDQCLTTGQRERATERRNHWKRLGVCACRDHPPVLYPGGERCEKCLNKQRGSMNKLNVQRRAKRRGQNKAEQTVICQTGPGVSSAGAGAQAGASAQVLLPRE